MSLNFCKIKIKQKKNQTKKIIFKRKVKTKERLKNRMKGSITKRT